MSVSQRDDWRSTQLNFHDILWRCDWRKSPFHFGADSDKWAHAWFICFIFFMMFSFVYQCLSLLVLPLWSVIWALHWDSFVIYSHKLFQIPQKKTPALNIRILISWLDNDITDKYFYRLGCWFFLYNCRYSDSDIFYTRQTKAENRNEKE